MEIENSGCNLADFDHFKSEIFKILEELKRVKDKDLADMFYRMELTCDEFVDVLDIKNIAGSTKRYTLPPEVYEITEVKLM